MTLLLRYAAKSDVGLVRSANEDSGFAGHALLAVADGMGGHAAGELASSTAIATLAELDSEDLSAEEMLTELDDAIVTSADRIGQFIGADPSRSGMGTTLTAILWREGRIAIIHVGDSRAYLLRDGELRQITKDHTYVQALIDEGRITAEQARRHPKRNLLLRAIDGSQVPERDLSVREAQAGDRYLLCTDGLCGVVEDHAIEQVLGEVQDPTAAVTALVDLALEAGAPDNVTAVVADVVAADAVVGGAESLAGAPVVVGAAGEQRNRDALPGLRFPDDVGPAQPGSEVGPQVAGGLAVRGADRRAEGAGVAAAGSIGAAVESGELPVGAGVGDTGVAIQSAAATRPGFLRRHIVAVSVVLAVGIGLAVGFGGFLWWLGSQWFVGAESGYVVIYQGVPQQVAGMPMSRVSSRTALEVATLPTYDQQQLEGTIDAGTREEADRIVADLAKKAAACAEDPPPAGCPAPEQGAAELPTTPASPSAQPRRSVRSTATGQPVELPGGAVAGARRLAGAQRLAVGSIRSGSLG